jgi:uncharacterized delta-60 repeat protein
MAVLPLLVLVLAACNGDADDTDSDVRDTDVSYDSDRPDTDDPDLGDDTPDPDTTDTTDTDDSDAPPPDPTADTALPVATADTGAADSASLADTVAGETADTGTLGDTGALGDTGTRDTASGATGGTGFDSSAADTGFGATGQPDTGFADTSSADTASPDTIAPDTGDSSVVVATADTAAPVDTYVYDTQLHQDTGPVVVPCIGEKDDQFGLGGYVALQAPQTTYDSNALSMTVDRLDRILLGGAYFEVGTGRTASLVRLRPNGTVDPTFGTAGWRTALFTQTSSIRSLHVLPDGRILAGGNVDGDAAVMRFLTSGAWDTSFGGTGWVAIPDLDDRGVLENVVPDGVGGAWVGGHRLAGPELVHLDASGAVDVAAPLGLGGADDQLLAIDRDAAGRIVVAASSDGDLVIDRRLADATPDPTFATFVHTVPTDVVAGLAFDDAGRILATGTTGFSTSFQDDADWLVIRLLGDGRPDPTFGIDGLVVIDVPTTLVNGAGDNDRGRDALPLPDGEVLVLGQTKWATSSGRMAVTRLEADGTVAQCFGTGGFYALQGFPVTQQNDTPAGMAWASQSRVVVGGAVNASATGWNGAARLLP